MQVTENDPAEPRLENWPVQVVMTVRHRDCGPDLALNESSLLTFFHEARRSYISILNAEEEDFRYRLWDARLKFRAVIPPDEEVMIRVRCDELGERAFRLRYRMRERATGNLVAEGSSVQVLIDDKGSDRVIPDIFRDRVVALEGREFPRPS
jgi:acyl-CoA thioesterase FadM